MARMTREVFVGVPHHVTQRGNGRQDIFFCERDRSVYLDTLFDYAERYSLRVCGYCLMTNHVHFVVIPMRLESLARVFGRTHSDYARYRNVCRSTCGHFWQARFYSCPIDQRHLWQALGYVERNPVRAQMVVQAEEYAWSSARAHCFGDDLGGRLDLGAWNSFYTGERWREVLRASVGNEAMEERIREATRTGAVFGRSISSQP